MPKAEGPFPAPNATSEKRFGHDPLDGRLSTLNLVCMWRFEMLEERIGAERAAHKVIKDLSYTYNEMAETLANPCGPNGRACLALMNLARP
jgi:hypothetical protein